MVSSMVAIAMPASPQIRMAITVAMAEAKILTKLLPIRITPINWSVRFRSFWARRAPLWPVFAMCFRRYRLRDIIPVSELEKKPDRIIRPTRRMNSAVSDVSFKRKALILTTRVENRVCWFVVSSDSGDQPPLWNSSSSTNLLP